MWRRFLHWLGLKDKTLPTPITEKLDPITHAELMAHAKHLFQEGVWVRDLHPGEVPSESPEIEDKPIKKP